ncbi:retrovirus-related pol polyprotein from transposon TNT 1-94 [Tanacetum coccineum]
MNESIPWDQKCKSSKELFQIKSSVDTIFDGVERCKQTIAKRTYFGHIDPLIQTTIEGNFCPQIRRINAGLEKFHLCLKEEMVADLRYFNSLEHEVDSLKSQLETQKTQFLNEINRLSREYYYADHMNAILGVYTTLDEFTDLQCDYMDQVVKCERLEKELSKKQMKNDKAFKENQSNVFLKEREQYFEIQDLKAQLQDKEIAISELKKLIEKMKGKSAETKFEKSLVIRQPNAFKSQRQSILGKPTTFSDSLAKKYFSKPVTAQILPQNMKPVSKNTNVIAPGMYKMDTRKTQTRTTQLPQDIRKTNKHVSFSTGVIPITSISRPQLKINQLGDRVLPNISEVNTNGVEEQRRNFKFSKNKTSVTACNDSLNAKTSHVNFVCVTCGKCLLNHNHDMCVLHYINGVNSRTKMPMVVPISTREPKQTVNQSTATPLKRTITVESTNQKPRSKLRKQYEQISKTCKWWYSHRDNFVHRRLWVLKAHDGKSQASKIFVDKFLGTVKFRNDQIAPILGYGDLVQGNITIKRIYYVEGLNHNLFSVGQFCDADLEVAFQRVYYVEGLNHNLFSVGQFCDADLEVAFRKSTCYIRDLKGNDLLTGSRGTDLYSITLQDTSTPNPICLMAKATSSQAWLWHHRLSHLNFDSINLLSKNDIVIGLPKLKFIKDHLCSSCELGKAKQKSFHTKTTPSSKKRLQLLHMDLCGPMRVESINGKKYVLVIVNDYSRYTWTHFLRSKDETPKVLIDFLRLVQRGLHAQNRTLVEAAQTILSAAKVPLFFWAEAIATACFTHNHSLVIPRHDKTPYHIINGQKPSVKFFHIFGSLCYIVRFGENLNKMMKKGDACIFVGYSTTSRAYRVYNKRTRVIVETIHVNFDELPHMASDHVSSDPVPQCPTMALEQDSLSPGRQSQENSSAVTAADAPDKCQQQNITSATSTMVAADIPPLNIQTTPETTSQAPTQAPTVTATENTL